MVDACYLCRRTQADLDRLNEEVRTRVYLSYFSNAHTQIEEQQRRITFLQRLKDEESGDPHFRIGAQQVFGDPGAYKKLMPWIDTLMEIADANGPRAELRGSIGEVVLALLEKERGRTARMEEGLNKIRGGFAAGGRSPLSLHPVSRSFPVEWSADTETVAWRAGQPSDREPLRRATDGSRPSVDLQLYLCSVCQALLRGDGRPPVSP